MEVTLGQQRVASADGAGGPSRLVGVTLGVLGLVAISVHVWFLYDTALASLRELWAPADFMQSISAAVGYLVIALVALRRPEWVRPRLVGVASALAIVVGAAAWLAGTQTSVVPLAVAGVCVAHLACSWPVVMVGISLTALGNRRDLVTACVLGEAIGVALRCVLPHPSAAVAVPLSAVPPLLALAFSYGSAAPYLRREVSGKRAVSLADTNQESFLAPSHRLFVLVGLFELIHGVALAEKSDGVGLATSLATLAVVALGAALLLRRRDISHEDALLHAAALMMLGGFMLRPLSGPEAVASGALSFAGASFSWMLLWMALASVGMGNPLGSLWTFGMGYVMQALGLALGAELGNLALSQGETVEHAVNVVNALVTVGFVAYLLIGLRGFSFSRTFAEIVPVSAPEVSDDPDAAVTRGCAALAAACELTGREADVLALLARGRSGAEIQEELSISRNTAKTHVRHIYRKAGVHSQQELIDLVRERAR